MPAGAWYHNLVARGYATIGVGADRMEVQAQEAVGDECDRLISALVNGVPELADYLSKTDRAMRLVLLTPTE